MNAPQGSAAAASGTDHMLRLSVVIPSRNERLRLPAVLEGVDAQTLQPDEVIVADGMSHDGSREWLEDAVRERARLIVVDNVERTVPAALNVAIAAARGRLVARMDTHADYRPNYLEELVNHLESDPTVCAVGAAMSTSGRGAWGQAIASVLGAAVGMGGAAHRVGGPDGPVDHVFTGCYRRSALTDVGGFDERLLANEDFELDARLREAGGTIWLTSRTGSTWYGPDSLAALARKMFRYGHYKALTLRLRPRTLRIRQVAPPLAVLVLSVAAVVRPRFAAAAVAVYAIASGGMAVRHADGASFWRAACVPPVIHLSWGAGLLCGLLRFVRPQARSSQ